eukprot:Rmarinus@m.14403
MFCGRLWKSPSKYRRLINACYPINPDGQIVARNVPKVFQYAVTMPQKLPKMGKYIENILRRSVKRREVTRIEISMQLMNELILACHSDLTLFAAYISQAISLLFKQPDTHLQVIACQTLMHFAHYHDDVEDFCRLDSFVDHLVQLTSDNSRTLQDKLLLRGTGLKLLLKLSFVMRGEYSKHLQRVLPLALLNARPSDNSASSEGIQRDELFAMECPSEYTGAQVQVLALELLSSVTVHATPGTMGVLLDPVFAFYEGGLRFQTTDCVTIKTMAESLQGNCLYLALSRLIQHLDALADESPACLPANANVDSEGRKKIETGTVRLLALTLTAIREDVASCQSLVVSALLRHLRATARARSAAGLPASDPSLSAQAAWGASSYDAFTEGSATATTTAARGASDVASSLGAAKGLCGDGSSESFERAIYDCMETLAQCLPPPKRVDVMITMLAKHPFQAQEDLAVVDRMLECMLRIVRHTQRPAVSVIFPSYLYMQLVSLLTSTWLSPGNRVKALRVLAGVILQRDKDCGGGGVSIHDTAVLAAPFGEHDGPAANGATGSSSGGGGGADGRGSTSRLGSSGKLLRRGSAAPQTVDDSSMSPILDALFHQAILPDGTPYVYAALLVCFATCVQMQHGRHVARVVTVVLALRARALHHETDPHVRCGVLSLFGAFFTLLGKVMGLSELSDAFRDCEVYRRAGLELQDTGLLLVADSAEVQSTCPPAATTEDPWIVSDDTIVQAILSAPSVSALSRSDAARFRDMLETQYTWHRRDPTHPRNTFGSVLASHRSHPHAHSPTDPDSPIAGGQPATEGGAGAQAASENETGDFKGNRHVAQIVGRRGRAPSGRVLTPPDPAFSPPRRCDRRTANFSFSEAAKMCDSNPSLVMEAELDGILTGTLLVEEAEMSIPLDAVQFTMDSSVSSSVGERVSISDLPVQDPTPNKDTPTPADDDVLLSSPAPRHVHHVKSKSMSHVGKSPQGVSPRSASIGIAPDGCRQDVGRPFSFELPRASSVSTCIQQRSRRILSESFVSHPRPRSATSCSDDSRFSGLSMVSFPALHVFNPTVGCIGMNPMKGKSSGTIDLKAGSTLSPSPVEGGEVYHTFVKMPSRGDEERDALGSSAGSDLSKDIALLSPKSKPKGGSSSKASSPIRPMLGSPASPLHHASLANGRANGRAAEEESAAAAGGAPSAGGAKAKGEEGPSRRASTPSPSPAGQFRRHKSLTNMKVAR